MAFQLFDVTLLLAYALPFTAVMLIIETFLVQPFERHVSRWRPRAGLKCAWRASALGNASGQSVDVISDLAFRLEPEARSAR